MGMVGGGQGSFIGAVHRIATALDQQVDLVAGVFSRDEANSQATAARLHVSPARAYKTYEEMAAAEAALPADQRIDFVSIVTPNNAHFGPSRTFLEAGIHVVCDKPLTLTLQESEDLVGIVEKSGLVFALTHNYTGYPMIRHARHMFQSGQIGVVRKVLVEYLQDWLMEPQEKLGSKQASWRTNPAESGIGGALGDIGTHALNLMEYVTGDPVASLCADTSIFLPDRRLDEDVNALLRFQGGGKGVLTVSQIACGEENNLRLRVYGSEAAISWEQENPNYLHVSRHGKPRETLSRGHAEYLSPEATAVTRIPNGHPEGYLEGFAIIYMDAVAAIRRHIAGNPMKPAEYRFPTVHDGLRGMQFIYKAVESAEKGAVWVQMPAAAKSRSGENHVAN
jgi:predicted dehydrogenase